MATLTEDVVLSRSRAKSLTTVKKLNCWGSGVSDISVLRKMPNVEVVTLRSWPTTNENTHSNNGPKLKELYVRRNSVTDLEEIQFLKNLPCLKVLWLSDNPCSESRDYRSTVLKNLPNIQKLDNIEVCSDEVDEASTTGKEYLVPDDIPTYTDINLDSSMSGGNQSLGLSENGNTDKDFIIDSTHDHQSVEPSTHELLDETNKLRTQLGLKPLVIEESTIDDEDLSEKIPVPCYENGLSTSTKNSNILSAVLLLLNDMDEDNLRTVQKEIDRKLETIQHDQNDDLECDKDILT